MTIARTAIQDFSTANPNYENATVTAYEVVSGAKSSTIATLYSSISGTGTLANPQTLDSYGKFQQPVYIDQPVILTVSGLNNVPDHDTGIINGSIREDVAITAAEIKALNTTPKTLIAAPGANKALLLREAVALLTYGSAAYTSLTDLLIRYTNGSGALAATLTASGFLDAVANTYSLVRPSAGSLILPANSPLVLSTATALATGDSPVNMRLFYDTIDLSTL